MISSTFLITTVTLAVTLTDLSTPETKKPQLLQGFQRFYMAEKESALLGYYTLLSNTLTTATSTL